MLGLVVMMGLFLSGAGPPLCIPNLGPRDFVGSTPGLCRSGLKNADCLLSTIVVAPLLKPSGFRDGLLGYSLPTLSAWHKPNFGSRWV